MQATNARKSLDIFLRDNKPGQSLIYHKGDLQRDRLRGPTCLATHALGRAAWDLMEEGKVDLHQKKIENHAYEYILTIRPLPHKPVQWTGCYNIPYRPMKVRHHERPFLRANTPHTPASPTQPLPDLRAA